MSTTSTESVRPEVIDAAEALAHLTTNEAEVQEALDAIARIRPRVLTGITAADVQTELRWLIDMLAPDWLTPLLPQVLPSLVDSIMVRAQAMLDEMEGALDVSMNAVVSAAVAHTMETLKRPAGDDLSTSVEFRSGGHLVEPHRSWGSPEEAVIDAMSWVGYPIAQVLVDEAEEDLVPGAAPLEGDVDDWRVFVYDADACVEIELCSFNTEEDRWS